MFFDNFLPKFWNHRSESLNCELICVKGTFMACIPHIVLRGAYIAVSYITAEQ